MYATFGYDASDKMCIKRGYLGGSPGTRKISFRVRDLQNISISQVSRFPEFPKSDKMDEISDRDMVAIITKGILEIVEAGYLIKLEPHITLHSPKTSDGEPDFFKGVFTRQDGREFEVYYYREDGTFSVSTRFPHRGRRESIDFDIADPEGFEKAAYEVLHWDNDGEEKSVNPRYRVKLSHFLTDGKSDP